MFDKINQIVYTMLLFVQEHLYPTSIVHKVI